MEHRLLATPAPFDLRLTWRALGAGTFDGGTGRMSSRTIDGPATLAVRVDEGHLDARAWGSGADLLLERLSGLLGFDDEPTAFVPGGGLLRDLHRRAQGLRLGSTRAVYEALLPVVIGQLVTTREAKAALRRLVAAWGDQAPGPGDAPKLLPEPDRLAAATYADLHVFGIERKRATIVIEVARRSSRLEAILSMEPDAARRRLLAVRGVGAWTAETVMGVAYGDRDAVPIGDYHLPSTVSWALAGEPRGTDDRMLELLEPFRPMRRRAIVLLKQAGVNAPRYGPPRGPRTHLQDGAA